MKKFIFMALVATTFFACSNNDENERIEGTNLKSLEFTLDVATPKTRMSDETVTGGAIAGVRANIQSVTIEYFNSASQSLGTYNFTQAEVNTVKSDDQTEANITDRKAVRINDIPGATTKVNVYLNVKQATNINDLQNTYKEMEYRGDAPASITLVAAAGGTSGNDLYRVEVPVKPVMSRFEFKGGASDIVINNSNSGSKPADNPNATEEEAKAAVSASTFANAVETAKNAWRAANVGQADPTTWTLSYALAYKFNDAYTITSIDGYYMNNIRTEKGSTDLILNANDASGNWDATGLASYNTTDGSLRKMFDTTVDVDKNIAYNLFPQSVTGSDLATIKGGMPHFILKLTTSVDTRWLTIRALRETVQNGALVSSFEAGKVYVLSAADITINQYSVNLTVTANGTTGPEIPEPVDPTDPNPEPVGKDLDVLVKIKDWTVVNVKPEW